MKPPALVVRPKDTLCVKGQQRGRRYAHVQVASLQIIQAQLILCLLSFCIFESDGYTTCFFFCLFVSFWSTDWTKTLHVLLKIAVNIKLYLCKAFD